MLHSNKPKIFIIIFYILIITCIIYGRKDISLKWMKFQSFVHIYNSYETQFLHTKFITINEENFTECRIFYFTFISKIKHT